MPRGARGTITVLIGIALVVGVLWAALVPVPNALVTKGDTHDAHGSFDPRARVQRQNELRAVEVQALAGIVLAIGAVFTARAFRVTREGHLTDRLTAATDQLGKEPVVRAGGILALDRLAVDSERDRLTILRLLSLLIRAESPVAEDGPAGLAPDDLLPAPKALAQTALTVIKTHYGDVPALQDRPLDLSDADLRGADLEDLRLADFDLRGCDLAGAQLSRVDGQGARLFGANLGRSQAIDIDLTSADLRGAVLDGANLDSSDLSQALLNGARLEDAWAPDVSFRGANLVGAQLEFAYLARADLANTRLTGAKLTEVDLSGADLRGADLRGANLTDADLRGANLTDADLRGAKLTGAHLNEVEPDSTDASDAGN